MDVSRFTESKTGQLVQIQTEDGPDFAFTPDPLPPNWEFPVRLWPLLAEAREELARLDEKGRTIPNPTLLLDPLQKWEALRSSSIEGTYATAKELLLFELSPRDPTSRDDKANDWHEVANYDRALRLGVRNIEGETGLPLSKRLIQEMHRALMDNVRGGDGAPGEFRTQHVYVGSGRRYIPPPPGPALIKCLNDLEVFLEVESQGDRFDPLVLSYLVHYQFEAIHPFRDGNGRIGRLLLALTTYQWRKMHLPWLYMSAYFERFKDEYVDNMFRVSTHGDWDTWIEYCLRGTAVQSRDAIKRLDALGRLRARMHEALDALPRMAQLIDRMFVSPMFSAVEVARWGSTSKPTARRDIDLMVQAGFVRYYMGERPRIYGVPGIFNAAYNEEVEPASPPPDSR